MRNYIDLENVYAFMKDELNFYPFFVLFLLIYCENKNTSFEVTVFL